MIGRDRGQHVFWSADRAILRTICLAAALATIVLIALGIGTRDPSFVWRSGLALAASAYAFWRLRTRRSSAPVFLLAIGAVVVSVSMQRDVLAFSNGMLALVALTFAASLLINDRRVVSVAAVVAVAVVTSVRFAAVDESFGETLLSGAIPLVIIVFGSQLMEWAKAEIRGREDRYEALFHSSPVAMWEEDFTEVVDWLEGLRSGGVRDLSEYLDEHPDEIKRGASLIRVLDVNDEAQRLLRAPSRRALLGRLDSRLLVEGSLSALRSEMLAVWDGRPQLRVELTGVNTLGESLEGHLLMAAPERDGIVDWSRVIVAMVDDSEQRATQRALEELVDSKDQFIAAVSHELRTPLTAVIGLADELRSGVHGLPVEEQQNLLDLVSDQAVEVGDLVEDLLIAAQANMGRVSIIPETIDLRHEVQRLTAAIDDGARPKIEAREPVLAIADPRRLRQILRNLVSNARRYGGDNVIIRAHRNGPNAVIEVLDDGDGVPDSFTGRIFEPYETAHRSVGVTGSVGLGLSVSRELARLMGGDLTYRRLDDRTVFRVVLPASAAADGRLVS